MALKKGFLRHRIYVDALNSELWIAEDVDGRLHFPVRPSCGALGIDPDSALDTIRADSRLSPGLQLIRLPSPGGEQPMQCLHSTEYGWWLAMLDPRRFRSLTEAQRLDFSQRQRILMQLAEDVMLKRTELRRLPAISAPAASPASVRGHLSGDARCPHCQRPIHLTVDGNGWHVHAGQELE